jgi:hypothetical protein
MSSKYGLLSLLVLGLVLLLIFKNYEIWTQPVEWEPEKSIGNRPQSKPESKAEIPSGVGAQKNPTSINSYITIAEKNVFSPERKDFPIPIPTGNGKRQLVRPQVILYGVTIAGDYQAASFANPGRPLQKGERETFTVKKGERIGEYKLDKVSSDRVTLEAGGDTFEVLLYDQSMAKKRSNIRTESKPATITSTQPVPSPPVPGSAIPSPPIPGSAVPSPPVPGSPVPTPPVPGSPVPTPPATSAVVPRPTSPVEAVQERGVAPVPGGPRGPRRGRYYPPSVPPQQPEGN